MKETSGLKSGLGEKKELGWSIGWRPSHFPGLLSQILGQPKN